MTALERQLNPEQAPIRRPRPEVLLAQLEESSRELAGRVAVLERLLAAQAHPGEAHPGEAHPGQVDPGRPRTPVRRFEPTEDESWLHRCEGFVVDSPSGEVGVVEGVRFRSRHDRPDEIEVRVGRLRPEVILVPVAEVEDVSVERARIVLRHDPRRRPKHRLTARLRLRTPTRLRALHH